jgi:predicted metal-dependent phosphotriesterase family hydrolase
MSTMPNRRDILRLIGASAAAAFAHRLGATDERPRFPSGAVIRTVLKDLPPEALAGGATLFHEHLSVGADFMPKVMAQFRILLGPDAMLPPLPPPEQQRLLRDLGMMTEEMRAAAAVTVFGPKLRNAGVTQSTLHGILVDNPRRFPAFIPKMRRGA